LGVNSRRDGRREKFILKLVLLICDHTIDMAKTQTKSVSS